jgi:amino acid adenylation domain-containing protein
MPVPRVRGSGKNQQLRQTEARRIETSGSALESPECILAGLRSVARRSPQAPALLGCALPPLPFFELVDQVERAELRLNALGVGRLDRVAVVLPNGPEAALAFLSVASAAVCAPLNSGYSANEFEFFFSDLQPKALIVEPASESSAIRAAGAMGIPVLGLIPRVQSGAGAFDLEGPASQTPGVSGEAQPEDIALVLHTSGSTAHPKLVSLSHANLCFAARSIADSLQLSTFDRCLNIMPLFHVHGLVGALLSALMSGGSVACSPGFHAARFFDWLVEFGPTWYTAVPSMHQAILRRAAGKRDAITTSPLRFVRSCSSPLHPKVMAGIEEVFGAPAVEAYGMTEASHQMSINPLPPGTRKPGSVGVATGCDIAILDEVGNEMQRGQPGPICIRGANVTRGYENNPEANASSFTGPWFRTGDEGRIDKDGYLFLTGRIKEMINRGGEKICPREIDDALLAHPEIAQAMAFSVPEERLGEEVGVAVVLQEGARLSETEIREFAAARLADFKVPRRIVFLDELPKGPTGKPQRIGMAERLGLLEVSPSEPVRLFAPPVTGIEARQASIWCDLLGVKIVGVHDDFFDLGGDSMLGAQLILRTRREFGIDLPMHRLFSGPTVRAVSDWIHTAGGTNRTVPIECVRRDGHLPTSFAQDRLWFLTQMEEASAAYTSSTAIRIRGPLRKDSLAAGVRAIVARHEVLRTVFPSPNGLLRQRVEPEYPIELPLTDLTSLQSDLREARAREFVQREAHHYFDLAHDFPIRVALLRLDTEEHMLILTLHHIASDGWSKALFFRELEIFYRRFVTGSSDGCDTLPELTIQYADFSSWRREQLARNAGEPLEAYWATKLSGAPARLELPTDRARPTRQTFSGAIERRSLPTVLTDQLRSLSRGESVTLYMTLLAAFQTLLARYSGQTDICVGTPVALRDRPETEALIGPFINTLPLRGDLAGDPTFRELLARTRETTVGAYDHQNLPLERIIEILQPARSLSHTPLFQVLFHLRSFPEISARLEGLEVTPFEFDPGVAAFDLTLELTEVRSQLECVLNFNTALFDAVTARRMLGHYQTLLEAVLKNPDARISALPLMSQEELQEVLVEWNRTESPYPDICVHQTIKEQVERTPNAVAAIYGNRRWTYRELDDRANQIAAALKDIGTGSRVAVFLDRSLDMLAALYGVLKTGAAYVPLDPTYPKDRVAFFLKDAEVSAVLTDRSLAAILPETPARIVLLEQCRETASFNHGAPGDLAYVIYTSGSTGKPKGVPISHKSLANLLFAMTRRLNMTARDTMLAVTTISFDIAGLELFAPLITGGRVMLASRETASDGVQLAKLVAKSGATIMQATPVTWEMLIEAGWAGQKEFAIVCGGEALPKELAQKLTQCGRLWNAYGPTETAIWSSLAKIDSPIGRISIGKPLPNTTMYVLDGKQQPLPVGVPGELYIGGAGLTPGYWNCRSLLDRSWSRVRSARASCTAPGTSSAICPTALSSFWDASMRK